MVPIQDVCRLAFAGLCLDHEHYCSCATHVLQPPKWKAELVEVPQYHLRIWGAWFHAGFWHYPLGAGRLWLPCLVYLGSHPGPVLERERVAPSSEMLPLPGLPLPPRLMVDGCPFALPRAFNLLANRPLHRLPSNSVHLGDHDSLRLLGDSMFGMAMEGSEGSHDLLGRNRT